MANNIRVTPEELRKAAQTFTSSNSAIGNATQSMLNIAQELQATWGGDAATTYYNKLNSLQSGMSKMQAIITKEAANLEQMAGIYESTESANRDLANSLSKEDFV
jgi:WXG100 family type VII secretion target